MKLILASAGFYTPEIVDKCVELVGKPKEAINFAVINEAYAVEHADHGWVLDDLNRIKRNFKGSMELVSLLALDLKTVEERIEKADVLFVVGGHTDYLMNLFHTTGFDRLLVKLLKTKVYVGSSAGSMIIGNRLPAEVYAKVYGVENDYGVTTYLKLIDLAVIPHLQSPLFPQSNKDALLQLTKNYVGTTYGLADNTAIVVCGDDRYVVGGESVIIVDGVMVGR
jgi:dipeptidase E